MDTCRYAIAVRKLGNLSAQLLSRKKKLLYVGGVHSIINNLGDHALYSSFCKIFNDYKLVEYSISGGRVIRYPISILKPARCALVAGGTLINRMNPQVVDECLEMAGRFIVFGTGVAQSYFWQDYAKKSDYSKQWAELLMKCSYVGVRGPISKDSLESYGVKNVKVVGDPVLIYSEDDYRPTFRQDEYKSIGLNIGQSRGNVWGSEAYIFDQYVQLAKLLKRNGWIVKWYVVWPDDLPITKRAAQESNTENFIHECYSDPNDYIEKVSDLDFFVGMKLHSVVLAHCGSIPSIMIEYRPKCLDYMLSVNLGDWNYRSDKVTAQLLMERILDNYKNRQQLSEIIRSNLMNLRAINKQERVVVESFL